MYSSDICKFSDATLIKIINECTKFVTSTREYLKYIIDNVKTKNQQILLDLIKNDSVYCGQLYFERFYDESADARLIEIFMNSNPIETVSLHWFILEKFKDKSGFKDVLERYSDKYYTKMIEPAIEKLFQHDAPKFFPCSKSLHYKFKFDKYMFETFRCVTKNIMLYSAAFGDREIVEKNYKVLNDHDEQRAAFYMIEACGQYLFNNSIVESLSFLDRLSKSDLVQLLSNAFPHILEAR